MHRTQSKHSSQMGRAGQGREREREREREGQRQLRKTERERGGSSGGGGGAIYRLLFLLFLLHCGPGGI